MAQTTRRIAAVSTGALLLCLWSGGTAVAATAPGANGSDPVGTITGAVPLPTPTPVSTPSQLAPVGQAVDTVTQTVSSPVPTTTAAPAPVASGGTTGTSKQTRHTHRSTGTRRQHVLGSRATRAATPVVAMPVCNLHLGRLRGFGSPAVPPPAQAPTVAPAQTAVLAAGQSPALAPSRLVPGSGDDRAPRGLFIALATMVIGGLAAGHVKVIQDRLGLASSA